MEFSHSMLIVSISFSLFLLMDPIGNIPLFLSILKEIPPRRQRYIILRELIIALIVIILFNFLGDYLLSLLRVSQDTVQIAGGIILFMIALKMVFPAHKDIDVNGPHEREPFIVPLAIPLVAGPAVLAAVMLYAKQETNKTVVIVSIVIAWFASTVILISSTILKKVLGWRGIIACERLMGLLLTLIAIQMFLEGLSGYIGRSPIGMLLQQ